MLSPAPFHTLFEVVFDAAEEPYAWLSRRTNAKVTYAVVGYLQGVGRGVLPAADASVHDVESFYQQEYDWACDQGHFFVWNGCLDSWYSVIDVTNRISFLRGLAPKTPSPATQAEDRPAVPTNSVVEGLVVAKHLAPKLLQGGRCYVCGPDRCICRLVDRG